MDRIIEYKAALGDHPENLAHLVNTLIKDGFQPIGGLCAIHKEDQPYVMQALVKYECPQN